MKKFSLHILSILLLVGCASQYPDLEAGLYADIVTNKGSIIVSLAQEKTPITVANFISLAEGENEFVDDQYKGKKYYDGILFHRVIKDFMIQGGDPTATGSGNPGYRFDDEITDLTHSGPGILSMANSGPGTNGSQFFITHKATPWLDGKHTVFGQVVEGQNIVDSIAQNDTIQTIKIIRKGSEAKRFDASKMFTEYFTSLEQRKAEEEEKRAIGILNTKDKFETQKAQSTTTASGLQYLITKKGDGEAVKTTNKAKTHYAVYFDNGKLLETSMLETAEELGVVNEQRRLADAYQPIPADVSPEAAMISGFKEGLSLLSVGDEATLFIPYELAYGENPSRGIPGKSNLVFEVKIVELIK
ncbi:MAG: peptidylprolyl isomerase [Flavobacteriaceae bacterium]|nr:peptidylprolyl isomerase [Flavobacteriaceae bacterium]